jgi:cellulose synthase/poly-beta-1,6-N-acetylglucosamine synthase-like glycosyltransferase
VPKSGKVTEPGAAEPAERAGSSRPAGASAPAGPTVSIVVPVYNDGEAFGQCLESLCRLAPAPEEVIVVADGDTQGAADLAGKFGFRVLTLPDRGGPARARNLGAARARGEVVLFVDADVTVPPDAVGQVLEAFRSETDLAAVIGSYDTHPAAANFLSQYKNLLHHYVHQTARPEASTFWGACGAIRRQVFLDAGGFDQAYGRPCVEDIDLGYRLHRAGKRIRLCKTLQVKHWKTWTAASLLKSDFFDRALPWTALILREGRMVNDLNLRSSSRASVVLAWGLAAAVVGACWWRALGVAAAGLGLSLLAVNWPLYRFFRRRRGLWFAVRAVVWHWLYYLYCGLAFALGLGRRVLRGRCGKAHQAGEPRRAKAEAETN